jgi:FkbM family methyltransferase
MIQFFVKFPILKRLIPSIGIRVLRFFKKNRGYFKIGEINFYLDFLDPMDRQIILHKKYENDQVIFIEKRMEKNLFDYFLDVGANSGYYSFLFASKFKDLKVKAFEPNLDAFNKFEKTLNKNSFQNIEVFNFGLSDREKKTKMYSLITHDYIHSNSTISKNPNDADIKNYNIFEAPLKLGDDQFNFLKKKLFIKIDVEGHEINTLKGLIKNLINNKCLILIEISNKKFSEVNEFLIKNRFKQIFKSKYRSDYIYENF